MWKCRNVEGNTLAIIFLASAELLQPRQNHLSSPFLRQGDDHGLHLCVQSAGLSTGAEEIGTEVVSSPARHHIAAQSIWQQRDLRASKDAATQLLTR